MGERDRPGDRTVPEMVLDDDPGVGPFNPDRWILRAIQGLGLVAWFMSSHPAYQSGPMSFVAPVSVVVATAALAVCADVRASAARGRAGR